jgi:intein/homing endonuclease
MVELAYLAGLFDGEGSIGFRTRGAGKKTRRLKLQVRMTDERLIRLFLDRFGGSFTTEIPKNPKHSQCWVWSVTDKKARETYAQLEPFLILKKFDINQKPV